MRDVSGERGAGSGIRSTHHAPRTTQHATCNIQQPTVCKLDILAVFECANWTFWRFLRVPTICLRHVTCSPIS